MQPMLLAGARAVVSGNGAEWGAGFVLNYNLDTARNEIDVVDNELPVELAPGRVRVDVSIQIYRLPDNDPVTEGFAPPGDGSSDYTEFKYLTLEFRDKVTDQTILYVPKASIVNRSGGGSAESLIVETIRFKGIGFRGPTAQTTGLIPAIGDIF